MGNRIDEKRIVRIFSQESHEQVGSHGVPNEIEVTQRRQIQLLTFERAAEAFTAGLQATRRRLIDADDYLWRMNRSAPYRALIGGRRGFCRTKRCLQGIGAGLGKHELATDTLWIVQRHGLKKPIARKQPSERPLPIRGQHVIVQRLYAVGALPTTGDKIYIGGAKIPSASQHHLGCSIVDELEIQFD